MTPEENAPNQNPEPTSTEAELIAVRRDKLAKMRELVKTGQLSKWYDAATGAGDAALKDDIHSSNIGITMAIQGVEAIPEEKAKSDECMQ